MPLTPHRRAARCPEYKSEVTARLLEISRESNILYQQTPFGKPHFARNKAKWRAKLNDRLQKLFLGQGFGGGHKTKTVNSSYSKAEGKLVHSAHCTLHSPLYTLHFELCTLNSELYTTHSALCPLNSTLFTLHSALCTLHMSCVTWHVTHETWHVTPTPTATDPPPSQSPTMHSRLVH